MRRAANDTPRASVTALPSADVRDIFRIRRAGYYLRRFGETYHSSEAYEKRPHHKHQFGHSALPAGGPDDPEAA